MPAKKAAKSPGKARASPAKAAKPPVKKPAKKAASPGKPPERPAAKAPSAAPRPRVEKTRVVFPRDWYEANKDEVKAPFKLHGLKWTYLGEGKGLYKREKEVHCFAQFDDEGTHYSLWGEDKKACEEILKAWRTLAGEALFERFLAAGVKATAAEAEEKESEALRAWKLQEPQPRPGEPEFFFKKRVDEWKAKRPA